MARREKRVAEEEREREVEKYTLSLCAVCSFALSLSHALSLPTVSLYSQPVFIAAGYGRIKFLSLSDWSGRKGVCGGMGIPWERDCLQF